MVSRRKHQVLNGWRCRGLEGLRGVCRDTTTLLFLRSTCKESSLSPWTKWKQEKAERKILPFPLGCAGEAAITWRDKAVEMGLLALWSTFLMCCTRSCPTPQPLVSPQLSAGPGRAAFQKFTCYLHFSLFGDELSLPLNLLTHVAHHSLQGVSCLSIKGLLNGGAMARLVGKMSKFLYLV